MADVLVLFGKQLQLAGLSDGTCKRYGCAMRGLQDYAGRALDKVGEREVQDYLLHLRNDLDRCEGTLRVAYAAVKFFFTHTVRRKWRTLKLVRAARSSKLPVVLDREEVGRIIRAVSPLENQVCVWNLYSLGLRISEVRNLKPVDIDSKRMLVHVHRGKGAKDRFVPLPVSTLALDRRLWKTHRNPEWLFPSRGPRGDQAPTASRPISAEAIRDAICAAVKRLGLAQHVTPHTFRHSYATHLLESGAPLRAVQEYLGHRSLKSTFVYVHLTKVGHDKARQVIEDIMRKPSAKRKPEPPKEDSDANRR